ncbi:MAG: hypothetical protein R3B95_19220 [Nitrospirales bacterium]|nr:hypothetical protein [Nitrospirales bacterium]
MEKDTKDLLIRGVPLELAEKMKTAASLHRMTAKDYLIQIFETHIQELEARGLSLSLEKKKKSLLPKGK